ncbi:ABC transporter substrate-binding protein [Acidimangrovimonas sediminis]|uniref:ABC transporter substrate-binding protein n=1 Tax=Acidimangrovimonas sediminis TaxID=2056283 RepID=UPI0018EB6EB2|nr:ABC transporter substrate-binding protein [Acidimangrovimonas sediminis]
MKHSQKRALPLLRRNLHRSLRIAAMALCLTLVAASFTLLQTTAARAADTPAACQALQQKYPALKGKTLVNAVNPHTPGYEALDPEDPSKYVGFDIDLGEAIAHCLGFKLSYKSVTFAALLTTLEAGQADIVISDIYATKGRAKAADFITYLKVYDGVLVAKGNPKKITGIDMSLCGTTAAENTGYVEVPLIQALAEKCKAAGKPAPQIQLYDNNANCIQAILSGRADTYINDANTVDGAVKAYPAKLSKATAVTLPYSVGIAVPRNKHDFRAAVMAALEAIQKSGMQEKLMAKWNLPKDQMETPKLVLAD